MTFRIGTPHTRGAGYFVNDRALNSRQEAHVRTCPHCQSIIKLEEWKAEGGWCSRCQAPICNQPSCIARTARLGCIPFVKQIEEYANNQVKSSRIVL